MNRDQIVHENLLRRVEQSDFPDCVAAQPTLTNPQAVKVFQAQCTSRALDRAAIALQKQGKGYYTLCSSGHEGMAAVATALRPTDMAFLHYRDGAFQVARAGQVPGQSIAWDMMLSFACSSDDPISGGRHKVLGSKVLNIPPQTSTIASHLPKAVGAAFAVSLSKRIKPEHQALPEDAIIMCSFGDASLNHSTAQGAINTAGWASVQSSPLPLLFVCEDNGLGISTRTPTGWVEASMKHRPGIKYFYADGLNLFEAYRVAQEASSYVRTHRKPAFLHLRTVRLYGHAGSDMPLTYLSKLEVEGDEEHDPLLYSVKLLQDTGALSTQDAMIMYKNTLDRVNRVAAQASARPRLNNAHDVMASLIPPARSCNPTNGPSLKKRAEVFGNDIKSLETPQTMNKIINWAITDLMATHHEIILMGEDVGRKGGVYGVTNRLQRRFGPDRIVDTLLDEQAILGLAIGMGMNGFIPMPEIQFLAYLHNAEDQIRGEAATLPFFSNGQFTNPMVLRIAGLGYQRGFGGHFHNDNSLAVLRDIPGIIIACPSRGDDAAMMLRECVRLAREEQRVVVFLEPIALYPMRDLHDDGDGGWMCKYPAPDQIISIGEIGIHGTGTDLAIVTYGNGHLLSRRAQEILKKKHNKRIRVIDMRWLAPLPTDQILEAIEPCGRVLIVDECRQTGSQSEALVTMISERTDTPVSRVVAEDSFIPTGPSYASTLPSVEGIVAAALAALGDTQ